MNSRPSVGRIVHYVSHGTPIREDGSQEYISTCRAAVVTAVPPADYRADDGTDLTDVISLAVFNPEGLFFNQHVAYDDTKDGLLGGTWHWPERV